MTKTWEQVTREEAFAVECPACGAEPGRPCEPSLTSSRDVRKLAKELTDPERQWKNTHLQRLQAAANRGK